MPRWRILALGLAASVPFICVDPAATQDARVLPDPIAFGGTASRDAVFSWTDDQGRVALLNLVVSTAPKQKGALAAEFLAVRRGVRTKLGPQPGDKYPRRRPALFANHTKDSIKLRQNSLNIVRLRLGIAAGASPAAGDGVLRLRLPGVKVDGKRVPPILIKTRGRFPKLTAQPDKISLGITRQWGFISSILCEECAWHDEQTIELHGQGAGNFVVGAARGPDATLRGDTHGDLDVTLAPRADDPERPRVREVEVNVGDLEHVGSYEGKIDLGRPGEGTEPIPVVVEVQDWFVWPLLVLLLGAALGGYLTRRYDIHRNRDLHRATLKRAVHRHDDLDDLAKRAGVYGAGDLLGPSVDRYPSKRACAGTPGEARLPTLYCEIHQATDDDAFATATAKVNAFVADLDRRRELVEAALALRERLDVLPARTAPELATLARQVLAGLADEPVKDADEERLLITALGKYVRLLKAVSAVLAAGAPRAATHERVDTLVHEYVARLRTDPKAADELLDELESLLIEIQTQGPEQVTRGPALYGLLTVRENVAGMGLGGRLLGAVRAPEEEQDRRSPEQIVGALQRWDLWRALATALVTAAAILIPLYVGNTFGTWDDYLTVFAAGFLGQALGKLAQGVAFNWGLFPALRSYRLRPSQPKPPAGGDVAA